ncbi:hypothetical protein [Calothrix sp. FACHB-168]|uniref:hypothetical protein n=1 Tax=Calothrix sp. FACHB-168 TaxID=2692780 RepID=UPI001A7EE301|nr:hypothetical protein [Calothrix sp. FACHB-168]
MNEKEYKFVVEILNGSTVEQAGEAVGIKRRSAYLWKAKEHIQMALEAGIEGEVQIVKEFRAERAKATLPQISSLLEEAAPRAIQILIELSETANFSTRLLAAKEIIRLSGLIEHQNYTEKHSTEFVKQKGLTAEAAAQIRLHILGIGAE